MNVKNRRGAILDTDHLLVFAELRIKLARLPRTGGTIRSKLNIVKLADESTRS